MQKVTINLKNNKPEKKRLLNLKRPVRKRMDTSTYKKANKTIRLADPSKKAKKKKVIKLVFLSILVIGLGVGGYFGYKTYSIFDKTGGNLNLGETISDAITQKEPELKQDENGLTSALLVGIDTRPTDTGLQNTDTIIVVTLNHKTNEVTMISLPRDLWVGYPDNPRYFTKINAIYNYCESDEPNTGMYCLVQVAETITNLKIHYYGMVDIAGFVKVIDTIGGVDVDVENAFTDYMFPTPQNTYETIHFDAGMQHMDGETAMKYARSRHAQSSEGSDFARARRQQKIIMATKEKILSVETLSDPVKVMNLINDLSDSIKISEYDLEDIQAGLNIIKKVEKGSMYSMVLDPMAGNWTLIGEDPSAAYILVPKAGAGVWTDIQKFVAALIAEPALYTEGAKIYIYNGGLGYNETYAKYQELITQYPYLSITWAGNYYPQTFTGTTIASFSDEKKLATLNALSSYYDVDVLEENGPDITNPYAEDITIIIGAPPTPPAETPAETQ